MWTNPEEYNWKQSELELKFEPALQEYFTASLYSEINRTEEIHWWNEQISLHKN